MRAPIRIMGGPYAGEIDGDALGPRPPDGFRVTLPGRVACYDLDIDAEGLFYRFTGWTSERPGDLAADLLRQRVEGARESARALIAECRQLRSVSRSELASRAEQAAELWRLNRASRHRLARSERTLDLPEPCYAGDA